jgi:hypothetical protein
MGAVADVVDGGGAGRARRLTRGHGGRLRSPVGAVAGRMAHRSVEEPGGQRDERRGEAGHDIFRWKEEADSV